MTPEIHDAELAEVLGYCSRSTKITAKTLFPELFWTDFCSLHEEIFKLIDSGQRKIAIAAPRGIGKTTIARTLAARAVLFRLTNFICYVMNSATVAEMQTENLKQELLTNNIVRQFFGNIKRDITDVSDLDESFSKKSWTAFGDVFVLPRGAGQQIRGLNWRSKRPGIIIVDDLENKKELKSEENRQSLKSWFFSDLLKSVDRYSNNWVIVYIDTVKHEDSLLQELLDAPEWASVRLSICDENYNTNAPAYMSTEDIKEELESHRRKGLLDEFYAEYMNIPISLEDATFRAEHFTRYAESDESFLKRAFKLETILIVDPAKTVKIHSADTALVTIGIDNDKAKYYVRKVVSDRLYPDEIYDRIFELVQEFSIQVVGIEVTSLHEFIVQPLKNEMFKRGIFFELIELKAIGSKEERIKSIVPYYRKHYILHNETQCDKLEQQLLAFPKPKLWDCMDCLGYLPKMLEMGERYFSSDQDEEDEDYDSEAEFALLEDSYEPALENWRTV